MAHTVHIQNDDGTEREVTDEAELTALHAAITDGTLISYVQSAPPRGSKRLILNAANAAAHRQEEAERVAAHVIEDAKKIVVTIDDNVMPATILKITLQDTATEARKALVKTRVANQEGVTPAQVLVETLNEYEARQ